ncbi:glycosyl hydrolase [Roseateles sp. BYS180W]|uniref:glucan endo-1,3-beta-D-glucosidase n=1 Tax=Roseateles rivi TaxID=3299028 RepID=A0ABW7FSS4_9BURK
MSLCTRWVCLLALLLASAGPCSAVDQKLGAGTLLQAPRGADKRPPSAPHRSAALLGQAAPTSQWYSSLIFNPQPDPIYAQPLSIKPSPGGFELALPSKVVVPTERGDTEIHYPHRDALLLAPAAFTPGPAVLDKVSDWAIDMAMREGSDEMRATVAHGSPYAYFKLSRGDVRISLPAAGQRLSEGADPRVLVLRVNGKVYAVFGPSAVRWEQRAADQWLGHLPAGSGYFSVAALPDDSAQTLQLLTRHAYAFVRDTRADWHYDKASSTVRTTFSVSTQVMEGPDNGPLLGLYPHQWHNNPSVQDRLGPSFDTVRGKIRLLAAPQFSVQRRYSGFVPHWPKLAEGPRLAEFNEQFKRDLRRRRSLIPVRENPDDWRVSVYWQGKGLTRVTQLAAIAEQQGDLEAREQLLAVAKERMAWWFSAQGKRSYFHYDKGLGTVVAYPDEFFAVEQMNDHHFHYGYWIRAAAEIALRDPAWAAQDQWGAMVQALVADIATAQRGRADFPFLRNFDSYEGHSWAVGVGGAGSYGQWGNNQESSSEAVNAWAGLILWGEVTGQSELRDLGVYLYTSEIEAIQHYWFDIHHLVFAPEYQSTHASMVFGAKYAHNTWWTDEPRQIHGINLLPVATFSTYLGRDADFVKRKLAAMQRESAAYQARGKFPKNPPPQDVWQDIFCKHLALVDPVAALAQWKPNGSVEDGETATHTLHWMLSLQDMGTPDTSVSADTTLYQVFRRPDGQRTYLAYNAGKTPITVHFSDGKVLDVAPATLARGR